MQFCNPDKRLTVEMSHTEDGASAQAILSEDDRLFNDPEDDQIELLEDSASETSARIEDHGLGTIPSSVLARKSLAHLTIFHSRYLEKPSLKVPHEIGELEELTELRLRNFKIESLSERVSCLTKLELLDLSGSVLCEVPIGIWKLPCLKWLMLNDMGLERIPEEVNLPELVSVELSGNQLESIPESIVTQPKLQRMKLEGNPLMSLPNSLKNSTICLELSIDEKLRLLEWEYRGADDKGLVPWNNGAYFVRTLPALAGDVAKKLKASPCAEYADALVYLAKLSVGFSEAGEEDYGRTGNHRFGGMPDLPPSISYPRFMDKDEDSDDEKEFAYQFIAQVNCAELVMFQEYLPRTGVLYFFLSTQEDMYGIRNPRTAKVIYYDGPMENLKTGKDLKINKDEYLDMDRNVYKALQAKAFQTPSLPNLNDESENNRLFRGSAEKLASIDDDVRDDINCSDVLSEMRDGLDFAINSYSCIFDTDPEVQAALELKGNPEDWIILLEVGSSGDFCWCDAGYLFFVIHKSDLMKKDFSNMFCTLWSS